jgi:sugar (pentulose or hexulose) kinase
MSWLARVLLESRLPAALGDLVASVALEDAPVFLPYLGGGKQGALWDPALRGSLLGLELRHERRHLARALLNGIVLESRRCLSVLEEVGLPPGTIHLAGGSAAVPNLDADLANASRRRVAALPDGDTDSSALGAAMLAACALDQVSVELRALSGQCKALSVTESDEQRAVVWDYLFARHDRALAASRLFYDCLEDPYEKELSDGR